MATTDDTVVTPIFGTAGNDALGGSNRSEVFSGRAGDDQITARSGSDRAWGGSGDDAIDGGAGEDILYGGGGPSYVDMAQLTIAGDYAGSVTFIDEGAGFRNALGMYRVDADSTISGVDVLFPNASKQYSGGNLIGGESSVDVGLSAGETIGFFIISNGWGKNSDKDLLTGGSWALRTVDGLPGTVDGGVPLILWHIDQETGVETAVRSQYGNALFQSAATPEDGYALNPDRFAHTVGRLDVNAGTVLLGFEDLWNGGDRDYDDTVFRFDVGASNARVLDPNLNYGEGSEDRTSVYDDQGRLLDADGLPTASENDVIQGGDGNDHVYGMAGHDDLSGGDGADVMTGNSGMDVMQGGTGNDTMSGGKHDDRLDGGTGNDRLDGNSGNDRLEGGIGDDTLSGSSGGDTLEGGDGADQLDGGTGDDVLRGGSGNDVSKGGNGDDTLDGGTGSDDLEGGKGDDALTGGAGGDKLRGGSGLDTLSGGEGQDYLNGGKADDLLDGGAGADRLYGGEGSDTLTGGDGADRFVFRSADLDGSTDRIADFSGSGGDGDTLDLRGLSLSEDSISLSLSEAPGGGAVTLDLTSLTIVLDDSRDEGVLFLAMVEDSLLI